MESGIRVDHLQGQPEDRHLFLLKDIRRQIDQNHMPPADELQPSAEERKTISDWIQRTLRHAQNSGNAIHGTIRRLTVDQYRNTLRDLLLLEENLSDILPPDGISRDGFSNHAQTMVLSPLQMEYYLDIAEKALDLCIVDESQKPVIQNFRVDLGQGINPDPCPDTLILGADSLLLNNNELIVTELTPPKPFEYVPHRMRTAYDFIEGYQGNDTVRGWRHFDSLYHSVFACMRGTRGYPLGDPFHVVPGGLLLRPAIPSPEIFGQSSTYGPMANFKISLRELPKSGNFRVTVTASRYRDAMLLPLGSPPVSDGPDVDSSTAVSGSAASADIIVSQPAMGVSIPVMIPETGLYQCDIHSRGTQPSDHLTLTIDDRQIAAALQHPTVKAPADGTENGSLAVAVRPLMLIRLTAGAQQLRVAHSESTQIVRILLDRVTADSPAAQEFARFEQRNPLLGVHVGLRRDCGSTLTQVQAAQPVSETEPAKFVFEGAINDFPAPDVEPDNVNYLAGFREIGVRSEYTDGRAMPRLQIHSVEFEGPLLEEWPPAPHRNIFIESPDRDQPQVYARQIFESMMTRAWRRPVRAAELEIIMRVWQNAWDETQDFRQSVREGLIVVLTSPQFLFVIEESQSPLPEPLDSWELAAKLSYFLWNTAPDDQLNQAAASGQLMNQLDDQIDRMLADPRCRQFLKAFSSEWLNLDKFDVLEVDSARFPQLTRDVRPHLRQEPVEFLHHLLQHNLPLRHIVQSDFMLLNDVVASYYGLGHLSESGFRFHAVRHHQPHLGGLLSQAAILAGLSDGRESNPVKRGAWLTRKILADPPDDPPPNVPQLAEDPAIQLTLRERLERHRDQQGCAKCHSGIDPWGIPFESFNAAGLQKTDAPADTHSELPTGQKVADLTQLKAVLSTDLQNQVTFSLLKHFTCYATGRSLTFQETERLREESQRLSLDNCGFRDLLRYVIHSDMFLKK